MSLKLTGTSDLNAAAYSISAAESGSLPMLMSNLSFHEEPFRLAPDQRFPYQSFAFQDAYHQLLNAIREGRGPVLLTGEAGTGKTLLLRVLKRELELIGATVLFPSLVHASRLELLTACLEDAHTRPESSDPQRLFAILKDSLAARFREGRTIALLVDDTQDLDQELLGTLAELWSLQQAGRSLLPIVLVGHPGVEEKLQPYLADSAPLAIDVCLRPLEAWEVRPFVLHRLRAAGHQGDDPFAAAAYDLIQARSKGVPRRIILLCGTALMLATLEDRSTVTAEDVEQALRDNWLDDGEAAEPGAADAAQQEVADEPRAVTGATIVRRDSWVERIQRTPATAANRHDERPAAPSAEPVQASSRSSHHQGQEETPTEVNEAVPEEALSEVQPTRMAADPNDDEAAISAVPAFRADERDAFHVVRRTSSKSGRWRWLRRPLLAIAGLAGGVLIGGLVATHYPVLTDLLQAQFRTAATYLRFDDPSAKTAEQLPPESASNDRSVGEQPEEAVATAYSNLAIVHQSRGELDQAETMYKKALEIHEALGHRESMARDYNNLGYIYWFRGDLEQAETVYQKSLELHKALGEQAGMADNYANLGSVYWTRRDLAKAEAMYRQALALNEALDRKEKLANNYGNLGVVYQTRGELQQAQSMHQQAIAIYERAGRQTEGLANAYGNLGSVYKRAGNLKEAEEMYMRALRLYQRVGNHIQANRAQALINALREANSGKEKP